VTALVWALAAVAVAAEIPYPLVTGPPRGVLTAAAVLAFAAAALLHAAATRPARYVVVLAGVGVAAFAAELLGVRTGVPFGTYRYTGGLGPTLGRVPLLVAAAWLMMAHAAVAVAGQLTRRRVTRTAVAAVALAAWDVFLDPQMVAAGHWRWRDPAPHLPGVGGVPLTNYGGWLLVALLLTAALVLADRVPVATAADAPMLVLWTWTWLSSTLANAAFFDRPAVAAWGFAAMGVVGVPLLARLRRASA
jgi:putative membrane protein